MKIWRGICLLALALAVTANVFGQNPEAKDKGDCGSWNNDRLKNHCETREQTLAAGGAIAVDASRNGGISVKGWERNEILVRAKVHASAPSDDEAVQLARQVNIETAAGRIAATGPERRQDYYWSVSFEVFVPRRTDLSLEAYNGGIAIADVSGTIEFTGHNGGVSLRRIGGSVHGQTTNGGLAVELAGDHWEGQELDVRTTNGGIVMTMPENYSAHLETGTVNGNLSIDFPVTVQGRIGRELSTNLGAGGATLRVMTTNGGVRLRRAGTE
jgi:Toastrack DUF4097